MARGSRVARVVQILLGRPAGGRTKTAAVHLGLILVWHPALFIMLQTLPLDQLEVRASRFWYEQRVTTSYITNLETEAPFVDQAPVLATLVASAVWILAEALLGWFGFRLLVRRPKPRWYHFVRHWWPTCVYAVPILILLAAVAAILPGSPGDPVKGFLFLGGCVLFYGLVPGLRSRLETARRTLRFGQTCPVCRYCMRGAPGPICPECGTRLMRAKRGDFVVAPSQPTPAA